MSRCFSRVAACVRLILRALPKRIGSAKTHGPSSDYIAEIFQSRISTPLQTRRSAIATHHAGVRVKLNSLSIRIKTDYTPRRAIESRTTGADSHLGQPGLVCLHDRALDIQLPDRIVYIPSRPPPQPLLPTYPSRCLSLRHHRAGQPLLLLVRPRACPHHPLPATARPPTLMSPSLHRRRRNG